MRKKTQYIVVNEIYKTIYCGYPQKRAWNVFETEVGKWDCKEDVKKVADAIVSAELLVRVNPLHGKTEDHISSEEEINRAIENGAKVLMLGINRNIALSYADGDILLDSITCKPTNLLFGFLPQRDF